MNPTQPSEWAGFLETVEDLSEGEEGTTVIQESLQALNELPAAPTPGASVEQRRPATSRTSESDGVHASSPGTSRSPSSSSRLTHDTWLTLLREVGGFVEQRANLLLSTVLNRADDALFEFVEKAGANQAIFFDAMRTLRKMRPAVQHAHSEHLRLALAAMLEGKPKTPDELQQEKVVGRFTLELIDEEQLERQLATQRLVETILRVHKNVLGIMEGAMAVYAPRLSQDPGVNPFGAFHISSAFQAALKAADIPVSAEIMLLKLYERQVVEPLGKLYDDVVGRLKEAGLPVQPNWRPRPSAPQEGVNESSQAPSQNSGRQAPGVTGQAGAQGQNQGQGSSAGGYGQGAEEGEALFRALSFLVRNARQGASQQQGGTQDPSAPGFMGTQGTEASPTGVPGVPLMNKQDTLQVLSWLQHQTRERLPFSMEEASVPLSMQIKHTVMDSAQKMGVKGARIEAHDEDAIDLVSMLFEVLLAERHFEGQVRSTLGKLVVPFIRVAVMDRRMFMQKAHPARRLLNVMTEACDGNMGENPLEQKLLEKVTETVERLVTEFNEDLAIFETLEQDFKGFFTQHRKRIELAEKRAADAAKGKERLLQARHDATHEVEQLLHGKGADEIPAVIKTFLTRYWHHHLVVTALRKGDESPEYREALVAGQEILNAVERAQADDAHFPVLSSLVPPILSSSGVTGDQGRDMLQLLRAGLASLRHPVTPATGTTGVSQSVSQEDLPTRASSAAEAALTAAAESDDMQPAQPVLDPEVLADKAFIGTVPSSEEIESDLLERVRGLSAGQWVEFMDDEGKTQPGKLSWVSPISGRMLFVNRRGLRMCAVMPEELAGMLAINRVLLRPVDTAFERALHQVMGNLKTHMPTKKSTAAPPRQTAGPKLH